MDEQEIIATQDFSEPEPDYSEPQEPDFQEPTLPEPESGSLSSDWGINKENGEVEFSDEYLQDAEESFFPNRTPDEEPEPVPEQPKYYTPEELANTPYEQWDPSRLNGNVRDFVPIVQQQIASRNAQIQAAQRAQANQLSNFIPAPVQYSAKELADEAQKLAVERLGLEDPEDFDEYESEHRAALNLAMQELSGRRQAEVANYQRATGEYQMLQNFNRQLEAQPDFKEFYDWYKGKLRERNLTPEQVNDGLWNAAKANGYNFGAIAGLWGGWYREFQQTKAGRPRAQRQPTLESSRGSYEGGGNVNLRGFGEMNSDQQAAALMRMGIV